MKATELLWWRHDDSLGYAPGHEVPEGNLHLLMGNDEHEAKMHGRPWDGPVLAPPPEPVPPRGPSPFTVVTVSMPERASLLAEAMETVRRQTIGPVPHLIRIEQPDHFGPAHVAHQRNAILKAVETPYMAVLDDDDLLDDNYLEVVWNHLDGADVVYTDCRGYPHPKSDFFDPERLRTNNYIDGEAVIRTDALREIGGYPANDVVEDWQVWVKLLDAGAKFVYVDQAIRTHRHGTLYGNAWRNVTH